ncbi:MAG: YbaN family protein [Actinomycetota bacterium]
MAVVQNRILRGILMALGWLWVGIAFVGVVVPVLPTTGPILLAALLFSKSSERFDHWLANNRFFGSIVSDWRAGNGFTVKAKAIAVAAIFISFGITTTWVITGTYGRVAFWLLAAAISTYVVTRPTKAPELAAETASVA